MVAQCPVQENTKTVDQSSFWSSNGMNWDDHRIGWAVSGGCATITILVTMISVFLHCRNYTNRAEQRQIIRILYLPSVYAVISFLSYRFFRSYTYYALVPVAYEALTIGAFLFLIIEYVASTASGHDTKKALARKEKTSLPIPFCCWRYRPTKPYFMHAVKWSVLQYTIVQPLCTIVGIICESFKVLCSSDGFNFHFAHVYLQIVDFVSISVALYGLIIFYELTKDELKGRRPLSKFLCIKLIVMATFYQEFVINALQKKVLHGTQFWTATNIADGLNALLICIEMVLFSLAMSWAYTANEYKIPDAPKTSIWRPLWDSINVADFAVEIFRTLRFLCCCCCLSKDGLVADEDEFDATSDGHLRMDSLEGSGVPRSSDTAFAGRNRLSDYESTLMSIPGDRLSQVGIAK